MSHSAQTMLFVRQQGWLIPEDEATFNTLMSLGFTTPRLHERYIPLLRLAIGRKPIRGKVRPFRELENEFHDALGAAWVARFGAATCTRGHIALTCASSANARKAIDKIDTRVREFAARWGMSITTEFSETQKRYRFTALYKFSADLPPMLPYSVEKTGPILFDLGFTRLEITFDALRMVPAFSRGDIMSRNSVGPAGSPSHMLRVLVQAGDNWVPVHTASFVDDTIGSMDKFMGLASALVQRSKEA